MTAEKTYLPTWWSHLSLRRIITSNRFIPEVDGFRFIAILIVVISHVYANCGPIPEGGVFERAFHRAFFDGVRGVFLFFTISGFILALPFARNHLQGGKKVGLLSYFKRRVTRLEPPYVLAMLLRASMVYISKRPAALVLGAHLLASLFYIHGLAYDLPSTVNPPAWSLEVEIQFYVLAPALTGLFAIRSKALRRTVLVGLMLASGILAHTLIVHETRPALSLLNYFQFFLAGFLLCDFYLCGDCFAMPKWLWDLLGVASIGWILMSQVSWYTVALPFATIVLYLAGFHGWLLRSFFSMRAISLIGGMCYSLYLTHTTVLVVFTPIVHRVSQSSLPGFVSYPLMFGLPMLGILLVGTTYFLLIERPCMDPHWPQKLMLRWGRTRD
jgi:peptidoglycan/LPS O-acetylase OafA/YrhL